ncbi:MAG: NAD(+)/NADH kinase [Dehalococcoidales bacterium]
MQIRWLTQKMKIKKIGILYHPRVATTLSKAKELESTIKKQRLSAWIGSAWEKEKTQELLKGTDLLLTVGGDGTILRAVQSIIPGNIPVTGINLGKLGFLTELDASEVIEKLPQLLSGKGWLDQRSMLQVELVSKGQETCIFHALNDVVMARGDIARLIRVDVTMDNQPFVTYRADAVVVATATGSTGYALAARGPIMHPQSRDFLLVPVAPHLSFSYPIVLPETAEIRLRLNTYHHATLSVDGHINVPLADGDTVTIKRSACVARFYRIRPHNSFFLSLEDKLKGKQGESGRKS